MEFGVLAFVISSVVAVYLSAIWYLVTRSIYRAVVRAEARPTAIRLIIEDGRRLKGA